MKKVRLNIETLQVESFEAEAQEMERGTVGANLLTNPLRSDCLNTCDGCPTYSCNQPINCA
jgi:hypothetical protein